VPGVDAEVGMARKAVWGNKSKKRQTKKRQTKK
jgi:hypothetical protein